jgi:hypothetical protein
MDVPIKQIICLVGTSMILMEKLLVTNLLGVRNIGIVIVEQPIMIVDLFAVGDIFSNFRILNFFKVLFDDKKTREYRHEAELAVLL